MSRTTAAAIVAIAAAAELLILALLLPAHRWQTIDTVLATACAVAAWGITIALMVRQASTPAGAASVWTRWPAILAGFVWGLFSALPIALAVELTVKWVLGLHALAGLLCAGVWVIFRSAGAHMDQVEADVAQTDDTHADLQGAIARTRLQLTRSGLDPALSQRPRTLLDRAQTVPRSVLRGAAAEDLVLQVIQVGIAASEGAAVDAALDALEDTLAMLKGR
jgi:hypothetical protein